MRIIIIHYRCSAVRFYQGLQLTLNRIQFLLRIWCRDRAHCVLCAVYAFVQNMIPNLPQIVNSMQISANKLNYERPAAKLKNVINFGVNFKRVTSTQIV